MDFWADQCDCSCILVRSLAWNLWGLEQSIIKVSSQYGGTSDGNHLHETDPSRKQQTGCTCTDWFHASSPGLLRKVIPKWILGTLLDSFCPSWTQFLCRGKGYPREICSYGRSKQSYSSAMNELTDCSGLMSDQKLLFDKDHSQTPSPTTWWTQHYLKSFPHCRGVCLCML